MTVSTCLGAPTSRGNASCNTRCERPHAPVCGAILLLMPATYLLRSERPITWRLYAIECKISYRVILPTNGVVQRMRFCIAPMPI